MKPILLDFPERFETDRLVISIYENGDGTEVYQLLQSNFEHLQEEIRETHEINSITEAEEYARFKKVAWLSRQRLVPKIIVKSTRQMIGQLWIEPRWDRMIFEIGYFLGEEFQGQGYITEAVEYMMAFLFRELRAHKLEILMKITNLKSIGVAQRCGFKPEAQLRQRSRTNAGEPVDLLVFGLLKNEFFNPDCDLRTPAGNS
jgi:RimJ/RimL family protein N-acetyltransferase